jgi:glycosidase
MTEMKRVLPGFQPSDLSGAPYCIRRYFPDPRLGGTEGLAAARRALSRRGLRLILDFVPNHAAPDAPWLDDHPEYGVSGDEGDLMADPAAFLRVMGRVFARGADPYSPPWPDVVQLNAFSPALRKAAGEVLQEIAGQCDGLRCDMAMLVLNDVFAATWGHRVGDPPDEDYWPERIQAVRRNCADFLFIAEAYWGRETDLLNQGFDLCYDKVLYDRLLFGDAASVRAHLSAPEEWQERLLRFLENHDEPRAADAFPPGRHEAAALVAATVPGGRLFHEGQGRGAVSVYRSLPPAGPRNRLTRR